MDKNHNGKLTKDQVFQSFLTLGYVIHPDKFDKFFCNITQNGSTEMNFDEFVMFFQRSKGKPKVDVHIADSE